jgi:hypothetical protein
VRVTKCNCSHFFAFYHRYTRTKET